jgi:hypothetical protein
MGRDNEPIELPNPLPPRRAINWSSVKNSVSGQFELGG